MKEKKQLKQFAEKLRDFAAGLAESDKKKTMLCRAELIGVMEGAAAAIEELLEEKNEQHEGA